MTALLDVQPAIYAKLTGDTALMALATGGIHDFVPQKTKMPYIVIGDATEIPDDTHSDVGRECTVTLHVWSDAEGSKQTFEIVKRLNELLDEQPLTVNGWSAWWVKFEFFTVLREDSTTLPNEVRHGVPRYRIHLQKAA